MTEGYSLLQGSLQSHQLGAQDQGGGSGLLIRDGNRRGCSSRSS